MANVTAERSVIRYGADNDVLPFKINLGMSASTKIFKGAMVGADQLAATKGQAVKGGAAVTQMVIGVAEQTVDNSSGAANALTIDVRSGVFWLNNSASTDAITLQHLGHPCYAVDDQTVALTDNGGTRPFAGVVVNIDATFGVAVSIGLGVAPNVVEGVVSLAMDLTSAANATLFTWTPQFAGKIKKITMSVNKAGAGAGATVTITPNIAATPLTGGVLTPTLANTLLGAEIAATAITGANQFAPGQAITLVGSAFTAFTAGNGTICLHIG